MVEQQQLTKGKAALLLVLSAVAAFVAVKLLHGWQVYLVLAIVGVVLFVGFLRWNRKY